ncbi:SAM-dependent methyltransferase [Actinomadura violacea]|uniref:SAM-dependent methyltransferase n=1 Tax=Actinomadura violacea TaxID=2819934 RepID=A0ABS3RX58_9ACTN|nr:SAM-dependent methyltransferase [Actinomadura violacea]MBO2461043.1 SAM-dependent methyltransferase [Actinomadura violacea]
MTEERPSPAGVDLTTPNTARIYDYLLGGKDNYAADREVAEQLLAVIPEAQAAARENHAFIGRAVRHLAGQGVRQFIDIGTKLPAAGNVHEVAARVAPDATVVFADGDPVVLVHARALLAGNERTSVVQCDLKHPEAVADDPAVREHIDFSEPVAVVLDRVLHFIEDTAEAAASVRRLHAALPPGGHLVFTHITQDPEPESGGDVRKVFRPTSGLFRGRTRAEVESVVAPFDLLEPGLTYTSQWRPDPPGGAAGHAERTFTLAGVGRRA